MPKPVHYNNITNAYATTTGLFIAVLNMYVNNMMKIFVAYVIENNPRLINHRFIVSRTLKTCGPPTALHSRGDKST